MRLTCGTIPSVSLPERLGRLQRVDRIGVGGFATVWLYHDAELRSDVAVKALADNWAQRLDVRERFLEEARILRRADSDHIVRVYDIGEADGTPYFVMTYADRGTLANRLHEGEPMPLQEAVGLVWQAALGLSVLHAQGIVHRDIKPQNLLLRSEGSGRDRVLVADLGVAKAMLHASGLTQVVGTPSYMAPEQADGVGVDRRADVHALGAVAYQMVTGQLVRDGSLAELSRRDPATRTVDAGGAASGGRRGADAGARTGPGRSLPRHRQLRRRVALARPRGRVQRGLDRADHPVPRDGDPRPGGAADVRRRVGLRVPARVRDRVRPRVRPRGRARLSRRTHPGQVRRSCRGDCSGAGNGPMKRFSDTTRCPGCDTLLPPAPSGCPSCGLPLTGPLVVELATTLVRADHLLDRLRASAAVPVPAASSPTAGLAAYPAPRPAAPRVRRGLSAASVPTILLGLGALCLLVAGVTFLAFAWSWLGIGGRTAVLVTLTVTAAGTGVWLARRGLRVAAESLTVVAFGLLTLDVLGADDAGWFGDLSGSTLVLVVGVALTGAALGLGLVTCLPLVGPQVVATIGLSVIAGGALGLASSTDTVVASTVVAHLALGALARLPRLRALRVLPVVALLGAGLWWLVLALNGLARAGEHATVRGLWVELHVWPLVAATLLLLVPLTVRRVHPAAAVAGAAVAAVLATVAIVLPALDESGTTLTAAVLVCLVAWSAVLAAVLATVPQRWAVVPAAPLLLAVVPGLAIALGMVLEGALAALSVGDPFGADLGVRLEGTEAFAHAALLVPLVAALLAASVALGRWWREPLVVARPQAPALLAVVGLAGIATLALHAVPLAAVVAGLAAVALWLVAAALPRTTVEGTAYAGAGLLLSLAAVVTALPSAGLTSIALVVVVTGGAVAALRGRFPGALVGAESLLPAALAALLWSAAEVASVDPALRAAPILLVVLGAAIARPRPAVEASAWLAALVASAGAVPAADDVPTALALHLTLAGALVTASSLVHPARRALGWAGGLLLAVATWVRLADLGVDEPEAYTLPSAVALVLVGWWHLWRHPTSSTRVALGPGLVLATAPSLLVVLVEGPVSLRAALLGIGCLAMVLGGTQLRWSAPVAVGATVGGLLVLRELAPYAGQTPQWVLIGLAGTVLTLVGVTWESRLADLRRSTAYLARLR